MLYIKLKKFMVPFYGWASCAFKFPDIPGTHFTDLGRMKG